MTGAIPKVMPMLTKVWNASYAVTAAATAAPKVSGARRAIRRAQVDHGKQGEQSGAGLEASFLPDHREDEVGLLLGDEPAAGLRAVQVSGAGQPAGPDRDLGLAQLVADTEARRLRVGEGGEPLLLVGLEQVQLEDQHRADRDEAQHTQTQRVDAPPTASAASATTATMIATPSAGSARISSSGSAAAASASNTSRRVGSPVPLRSVSNVATITATASLANSDGVVVAVPRNTRAGGRGAPRCSQCRTSYRRRSARREIAAGDFLPVDACRVGHLLGCGRVQQGCAVAAALLCDPFDG